MGAEADHAAGLETSRDRLEERLRRISKMRTDPESSSTSRRAAIVAEANALGQLVIADEIAGLRSDLQQVVGDPDGAGTIRDQIGWALDNMMRAFKDMTYNISEEAMRHRR
jgi:hypothetical protein